MVGLCAWKLQTRVSSCHGQVRDGMAPYLPRGPALDRRYLPLNGADSAVGRTH